MDESNVPQYILEEDLHTAIKSIDPQMFSEMLKKSRLLGYLDVYDYLVTAHKLYSNLVNENLKGKIVMILTSKDNHLKKEGEKVYIEIRESDRILNFKVKGLEYKVNGNEKT